MALRIQRSTEGNTIVFTVSGRIEGERLTEIQDLLHAEGVGCHIVLDLQDVDLVDRDAVKFLARCRAAGVELSHCPGYIREWMQREEEYSCQ